MVQNVQDVTAVTADEGQLDTRLADLLRQMRDQHLEQPFEQGAGYGMPMSRAAM
jgi:hypothetical protein